MTAALPHELKLILEHLDSTLNLEELQDLCLEIGVDFDNLGAPSKRGKIRELILLLERRGRLGELQARLSNSAPAQTGRHSPALPKVGIVTVIGTEQRAMKAALGIKETDRVVGDGRLWYETILDTTYNGRLLVQLHAQGEAGNTASAADATKIIAGGVHFMLLCGIAAGVKSEVKIGDVIVPRAIVDTTTKVAQEGELGPRPKISSPLKGVLQMNAAAEVSQTEWHDLCNRLLPSKPVPPRGQKQGYARHVATVPGLHESAILSDNLLLRDPTVLADAANGLHQQIRAGEMEAAGFVQACMGAYPPIPWYVVRGISDFGDSFKDDQFQVLAATAVAAYVALYLRDVLDLRIWGQGKSGGTS